jgi:hypothetical protein
MAMHANLFKALCRTRRRQLSSESAVLGHLACKRRGRIDLLGLTAEEA